MSDATTPVILSAGRTPVGKYLGGLAPLTAPALGALVVKEAVRLLGRPAGPVRPPASGVSPGERAEIERFLRAAGLLETAVA